MRFLTTGFSFNALTVAAAVFLLAGCLGNDTPPATETAPSSSSSASGSSAPGGTASGNTLITATSKPENIIEKSRLTAESMFSNKDYATLLNLASRAKAILIFPDMVKAGIFIGGRFGRGVLLARDAQGNWSAPAFYSLGGLSYGLQLGASQSEIIIAIMTDKGLNAILERSVTLGADGNVALGQLGTGAQAATGLGASADMYAFARSEGLFAGISIDGSVLAPDNDLNEKLYGAGASPRAILVDRSYSSPAASALIGALP